jgi:PAS domain S-box-containing protein
MRCALRDHERRILQVMTSGVPLDRVLEEVCLAVEASIDDTTCSIVQTQSTVATPSLSRALVRADGGPLGTLVVTCRRPRVLNEDESSIVEHFSYLATMAIEREVTETARARSEQHLREAQRLSRTGSFEWHPKTGVLFLSDEARRIFDVSVPAPRVDDIFERVHADDRGALEEAWKRAAQGVEGLALEPRLVAADGSTRYLQISARVVHPDAGMRVVVGTVMDVTAQKRSMEELERAKSALAHVSRRTTLGELAASIAHEVNQPIAAIVGDAGACLNWLANDEPDLENVRRALEAILKDGERAGEVLQRIRALLARTSVARERCDLSTIVASIVPLARAELRRDGIALEVNAEKQLPAVLADPVELQQVLLNLLLNAIEASKVVSSDRRRVVVRTFFEAREDGLWVGASVEDAGVGLRKPHVDELFEPFFTTKREGLGMGLSISRSIIMRHAGEMSAAPNPTHGMTFRFVLPEAR